MHVVIVFLREGYIRKEIWILTSPISTGSGRDESTSTIIEYHVETQGTKGNKLALILDKTQTFKQLEQQEEIITVVKIYSLMGMWTITL